MNEYLLKLAEQNAHHIEVLNGEFGTICERLAVLETKVASIEKIGWLIIGAVIASAVGVIFSHISIKKEMRK